MNLSPSMKVRPILGILLFVVCAPSMGQTQTEAEDREATRLNDEAVELAEHGRNKEALPLYDRALALSPKDDQILSNRALTLADLWMSEKAIQDANELVRRHPLSTEFLALRGTINFHFNRDKEGRADYRKAIGLDPDNTELLGRYVDCLSSSGREPEYFFQKLRYLGLKGTPGAVEPNVAFPLGTEPEARRKLMPLAGEIRFHGRVMAVNPRQGAISLEVAGFGTVNGGFRALEIPKLKTIYAHSLESPLLTSITPPLALLRRADFLIVLGKDGPGGVAARSVIYMAEDGADSDPIMERFNGEKFREIETPYPGKEPLAVAEAAVFAREEDDPKLPVFIARDEQGPALFVCLEALQDWTRYSSKAGGTTFPSLRDYARQVAPAVECNIHHDAVRLEVQSRHVESGSNGQLLALRVSGASNAMPLAKKRPARGETVWVVGQDGAYFNPVATGVIWSDEARLLLVGSGGDEDGRQSGSVVINKDGEIVGVAVQVEDVLTYALPVDALHHVLAMPPVK